MLCLNPRAHVPGRRLGQEQKHVAGFREKLPGHPSCGHAPRGNVAASRTGSERKMPAQLPRGVGLARQRPLRWKAALCENPAGPEGKEVTQACACTTPAHRLQEGQAASTPAQHPAKPTGRTQGKSTRARHTKQILQQQRNTALSFKIQAAQSHPKTIDIS